MKTDKMKGPVTKAVVVDSNDPVRPRISLTLRVDVLGSVIVLPEEVLFMRSRPGRPVLANGLVRKDPTETGTLEVRDVETSEDWLIASVEKVEEVRPRGEGLPRALPGDWRIEVRFRDDEPVFGRRRANVTFSTGLPRQPTVELALISNLPAPVNFSTNPLVLSPSGSGWSGETVLVSVRRGLDPTGLRVESDPPGIEIRVEPSGGRMFKVGVAREGEELPDASLMFHVGGESVRLPIEWGGGKP